ncbi:peptidase S14, partial [Methylobacterium sp. A54F]
MDIKPLAPFDFRTPAILLSGPANDDMYRDFRRQPTAASELDLVVVELTTLGGDPEVARMMGE